MYIVAYILIVNDKTIFSNHTGICKGLYNIYMYSLFCFLKNFILDTSENLR